MGLLALAALTAGPTVAYGKSATISAPANTAAPLLSGTPKVGSTLTCSQGSWANSPTGFAYSWLRNGTTIAGQSANTYTLQSADRGTSISCKVTATTSAGEYTISGLPSGSYTVSFSAQEEGLNFLSQYFNGKSAALEADPVAVSAGSTTSQINADLSPGGEITGRVTSAAHGEPIEGASVSANDGVANGFATTNASGEYVITDLPTGSYTVEFSPPYQGRFMTSTAGPVAVTAGNQTGSINAALEALPVGSIEGHVEGPSALALEGVTVNAFTTEGQYFGSAKTTPLGDYTISNLPAATYIVEFVPNSETNLAQRYYDESNTETGDTEVTVTAAATRSGINAKLAEGGKLEGKVTNESASPLAGVEVRADDSTADVEASATTDSEGNYVIAGLQSGTYEVIFFPYPQNYLTETLNVAVSAGATKTSNAALKTGAQISGRVTSAASGMPLAETGVTAFGSESYAFGNTNANGEYTLIGLQAGAYTVEFTPDLETGNYLTQYFSGQPTAGEATPVSVGEGGAVTSVNAALAAGGQITGRVTSVANSSAVAGVLAGAQRTNAHGELEGGGSATTDGGGGVVSATSGALAIPAPTSSFALTKPAKYNAKTGMLEFTFKVIEAGTFHWVLTFKNSDVAYADSLGLSAEAAKSKRCKKGLIKHKGKCVHVTVPFASGSKAAAEGVVVLKIHASAKALKGLKQRHTLHVSGTFTFQSTAGGAPVLHSVNVTIAPPKQKKKKKKK